MQLIDNAFFHLRKSSASHFKTACQIKASYSNSISFYILSYFPLQSLILQILYSLLLKCVLPCSGLFSQVLLRDILQKPFLCQFFVTVIIAKMLSILPFLGGLYSPQGLTLSSFPQYAFIACILVYTYWCSNSFLHNNLFLCIVMIHM